MSDLAEKSESLRDYAEMLGSPDATTTARMRAHLDDFMLRRRRARRRWLVGIVGALALAGAAFVAIRPGDPTPAIISADAERTIEIGRGRVVLHAGARVGLDPADDAKVELVAGELDVTVAEGHPFVVVSGAFEVRAEGGRFAVRHTGALPVVAVTRGSAVIRGPGLPQGGVRVLAP